jgi:ubiquinone/menaquinone biosynthesis C-methylase UbiE
VNGPISAIVGRVRAWLYDVQMRLAASQVEPWRRTVAGGAQGLVLEVGIGTAQNAPFYSTDATVVGIDPDPSMRARARKRIQGAPARIHLVAAAGEAIPFGDGIFDSAVVTLALCSVESLERTLSEVHRVVKPEGTLRFLEHVRSDSPSWARFQDIVTPIWKTVDDG